jgi:thiol peroxidase
MATTHFKGNPVITNSILPNVGSYAPDFNLVKLDLSTLTLSELKGKNIVLNIFPSIDTGVCAASVRRFNKEAADLENTLVVCISKDLPFAQKRFCGAEGIDNVIMASEFKNSVFSHNYGVLQTDGPLEGLMARAVVILDEKGKVKYTELVDEITTEPNYEAALNSFISVR